MSKAVRAILSLSATICQIGVSQEMSLIPNPVSAVERSGSFVLTAGAQIAASAEIGSLARALQGYLAPATGYSLNIVSTARSGDISLALDRRLTSLGAEGYRLQVTPKEISIRASQRVGIFYGIQTLRQLMPPDIFRKGLVAKKDWKIACLTIEDFPRFSWRGSHIDVSRHFMPKEFILKYIELLALHKLNVLHLHLTDDQGWRIEIRKYPRLTEIGSRRSETLTGRAGADKTPRYDGKVHSGFFTQDDIREIVAYATERFITVVPEIEMPGHARAALAAYPQFGNTGKQLPVATTWGVFSEVFSPADETILFLQDILTEVLDLFPSRFIHIGGDEVPKDEWKKSENAQAKMKSLGLKDENELQSWFVRQMDSFLAAKGRRLIGWDEILEGGLAPGATVMSWRGEQGGITAAKAGHDVVMAPTDYTYFDYYQSKDRDREPLAIGGLLPLQKAYSYNPMPSVLSEAEARHILGAQFQLWSEYIQNPKQMEYMAFPRACALAEAVWSREDGREFMSFLQRLKGHLKRLTVLDVNFRALDAPIGEPRGK